MWWIIYAYLKRRKIRVFLTMLGIAVGVATLFTVLSISDGIDLSINQEMQGVEAQIFVIPYGHTHDRIMGIMEGEAEGNMPSSVHTQVKEIDNVKLAVPVIMKQAKFEDVKMVPVVGTTKEMGELKLWSYTGDFDGAVLGAFEAMTRAILPGDTIRLEAQTVLELEVIETLEETSTHDDHYVFIPLASAQELFGEDGNISAIFVTMENPEKAAETIAALNQIKNVDAVFAHDVFQEILDMFAVTKANIILITGIAIVAGAFTTINTMTMAVYERKKDIGLSRAVGATQMDIFTLFMVESIILSIVACVLGILIGYAFLNLYPLIVPISIGGIESSPYYSPHNVLLCFIIAYGVGTISGIYPAISAARLAPIDALRGL
ncbi:MAG: ABC transporter permease [Methanocellales archaeon]|nr:ABC transporter permease [Methanocellales archaeon]MDD5446909.1 ABC transporter permease [Methanocellales archaeon]